jgi:hypothetical protein
MPCSNQAHGVIQLAAERLRISGARSLSAICRSLGSKRRLRLGSDVWASRDAVRTGLILRLEGPYALLHDRIQEAAYALIAESARAEVHLRIGLVLLASLTVDGLAEHLFDVAHQLNFGAALLSFLPQNSRRLRLCGASITNTRSRRT